MSSLYLTPSDAKLLKQVELYLFYVNKNVEFQFPPKISTDSRKMNWKEHQNGWGADPTSNFMGNGPRELALKIEYIVEDDTEGFTKRWNIRKIKENINLIKGVFSGFREDPALANEEIKGEDGGVLVRFKYPLLTGFDPKTFRISTISVDYSDELIFAKSSTFDEDTLPVSHPLKSVVTVSMASYSIGDDKEPNQDWEKASIFPSLDELWY